MRGSNLDKEILDLWSGENENQEYAAKVIEKKFDEKIRRTVWRRLTILSLQGKLKKIPKAKGHVDYKIGEKYKNTKEQFGLIGDFVLEALSKSIAESKEKTDRLYEQVWEEIGSKSENKETDENSTEAFETAISQILNQESNKQELKIFYNKYDALMKACLQPLTDPTVFARLVTEQELPDILQDQVENLVIEFMILWDFVYKHPRIVSELKRILEEEDPRRLKAKIQVQHPNAP